MVLFEDVGSAGKLMQVETKGKSQKKPNKRLKSSSGVAVHKESLQSTIEELETVKSTQRNQ
jgi:hypothetical protein